MGFLAKPKPCAPWLQPLRKMTVPSGRIVPSTMPRPSGIESISQAALADRGCILPQLGSVGLVMSW